MTQEVQELLTRSNGTEGTLLIPRKIFDQLLPEVTKAQIGRQYAAHIAGPSDVPGSSIDFNIASANAMTVFKVAEGAAVPVSVQAFTTVNVKPDKYGTRPLVTKEMLEDNQFNMVQTHTRQALLEMAYNETALVVSALDGAASTVAGGAALTIANITTAKTTLENSNFHPDVMFVGPEAYNDLLNLDTFVEYNKSNSDTLRTGAVGKIFGMDVVVVTAGGFTTTSSYILDSREAYALVEKRPIAVQQYEVPEADQMGIVITQRLAVSLLKSSAVVKITTS